MCGARHVNQYPANPPPLPPAIPHLSFLMDLNSLELMAVGSVLGTVKRGLTFHPIMMFGIGAYVLFVAISNQSILLAGSLRLNAYVLMVFGCAWLNGVRLIDWIDDNKRGRK